MTDELPPFIEVPPRIPAVRLSRRTKKKLIGYACILAAAALLVYWQSHIASKTPPPTPEVVPATTTSTSTADTPAVSVTTTNAVVVHVVDGDTIDATMDGSTNKIRIRLLGVNTPEVVDPRKPVQCFGKEASAFAKSVLTIGRRIRLDADPQADDIDKYGRSLRNIILEDGTDFNAELVREGYAYAYLSFPLNAQRKTELKRLQNEAEQAQRGLWNPKTCNGKL